MDLKGSLVDNKLKIIPTTKLIEFLKTISITDDTPLNILNFSKDKTQHTHKPMEIDPIVLHLSKTDLEVVAKIKEAVKNSKDTGNGHDEKQSKEIKCNKQINSVNIVNKNNDENTILSNDEKSQHEDDEKNKFHLTTSDVDWLYLYLEKRRKSGEKVPYLHEIMEMVDVELPENKILKRNPVLEARCVKLRAQQEAREYRKMTKSVDNVRMRYPEDTIAYQLKSMNRQLIAIGQFIISIFAGFLFGFKGVEWMIGKLDFGFRLLLGVMCALIIALAEIYFLAKKLNEELNIPETVQLGGPPKFAQETHMTNENKSIEKVHQD